MFLDSLIGRPNTIRTYRSLFNTHLADIDENTVKELNIQDIRDMIQVWENRGLKPRTILSLLRLLSKYIEYCKVDLDISKYIKAIQRMVPKSPPKALSAVEVKKLLKKCKKDKEFYTVILLGLNGLRRGEVFGLTSENIDLNNKQINIVNSYDSGVTKGGESRKIKMLNSLYEILNKRNYSYREETLFKTFDPNPKLKKYCREAGIREIRFHDLRHTYATLALENGKSFKQVQEALGHKQVSTTVNIYWSPGQELEPDFIPEV